jgi:hypothetical protein
MALASLSNRKAVTSFRPRVAAAATLGQRVKRNFQPQSGGAILHRVKPSQPRCGWTGKPFLIQGKRSDNPGLKDATALRLGNRYHSRPSPKT